jgi:hypothetical protein
MFQPMRAATDAPYLHIKQRASFGVRRKAGGELGRLTLLLPSRRLRRRGRSVAMPKRWTP